MRMHAAALFFVLFYVVIAQAGYQYCSSFIYCKCGYYKKIYRYCNNYFSKPEEFCKRFYGCSSYTGYINSHDKRSEGLKSYFYKYDCQDPGFIPNAIRQTTGGSRLSPIRTFKKGETVTYACESKFEMQGTPYLTCTSRGVWSSPLPKCIRLSNCQDPGFIPNAIRQTTAGSRLSPIRTFKKGETVTYACESKFEIQGTPYLTCTSGGVWSSPLPKCTKRSSTEECQDPGFIPNSLRQTAGDERLSLVSLVRTFKKGEKVIYSCDSKLKIQGTPILTCTSGGVWSDPLPKCINLSTCEDPGFISNAVRTTAGGYMSSTVRRFIEGEIVKYTCESKEFGQQGSLYRTCTRDGVWTAPILERCTPTEDPTYCRDPGTDANAVRTPIRPLLSRGFIQGARLEYTCNEGYYLQGDDELFCLNTGTWSSDPPTCRLDVGGSALCNNPGPNLNGVVSSKMVTNGELVEIESALQYPIGIRLEYSCEENHVLEGSAFLVCEEFGNWSSQPPSCFPKTSSATPCKNPGPFLNGKVTPMSFANDEELQEIEPASEYPFETHLNYSCFDDYVMEGDSLLFCDEYGTWSDEPPMCFPKCGVSFADVIPAGPTLIEMNGTDESPWTVTLTSRNNRFIECTGVLIDQNTVLTAASQVSFFKTYFIYFGRLSRNLSTNDTDVNVRVSSEIIFHPHYNSSIEFENDIALVKFAPKVRYTEKIMPICLPTKETTEKNIRPGNIGYVAGHKLLITQDKVKLMIAQLPVLSTEDCEQFSRYNNFNLTGNYFCVGSPTESWEATCLAEGSSFAFYDSQNDVYILEGIVTSYLCEVINIQIIPRRIPPGSYFGMVKVQSFLPWIIENISN